MQGSLNRCTPSTLCRAAAKAAPAALRSSRKNISFSSSHSFSSTACTAAGSSSAAADAEQKDQTRIKDFAKYLSPLSKRRQPSAIRKLMPLLEQPGMVSLGGGLPNSALFPFTSLKFGISDPRNGDETELHLNTEELGAALQYSPTPGLPKLVTHLRDLQTWEHGVDVGKSPHHHYDVMVSVGSQDALTKAFEMLLDPAQDELFLESPTYSGSLAFLQPFGVKMKPVATDEFGLKPEALQEALEKSNDGENKRRVLYTIPTAQNPSGSTLSNDRREAIYDIASAYDIIILEDDAYYYNHPARENVKSFLSLDCDGRVIRFDTFSKLISSGMRIGFVTGPPKLIERLSFHTQATNLHNSGVSQIMLSKLLDHWGKHGFDEHAKNVASFYCRRRDVMLAAAERHLTGLAAWSPPEAGMFLFLKLNGIDDTKVLIEEKAAAANVLFVPGQSFDPLDRPSPYVRASFSTASDEDMDIAMERLAALIANETSL